jgi:hypothetical protein
LIPTYGGARGKSADYYGTVGIFKDKKKNLASADYNYSSSFWRYHSIY